MQRVPSPHTLCPMPPEGESADEWTNRLHREGAALGVNRQCSIGWHEECSDHWEGPDAMCRCLCHEEEVRKPEPEDGDEDLRDREELLADIEGWSSAYYQLQETARQQKSVIDNLTGELADTYRLLMYWKNSATQRSESVDRLLARVEELKAEREETCTCGYGGMHEESNPLCDRNGQRKEEMET